MTSNQKEQLGEKFQSVLNQLIQRAEADLELAKALADQEGIFRLETKLRAYYENLELYQLTEQKTEGFLKTFFDLMQNKKETLRQSIKQARVSQSKQELIMHQIELSVIEGPVEGALKGWYRNLTGKTFNEVMNVQ